MGFVRSGSRITFVYFFFGLLKGASQRSKSPLQGFMWGNRFCGSVFRFGGLWFQVLKRNWCMKDLDLGVGFRFRLSLKALRLDTRRIATRLCLGPR